MMDWYETPKVEEIPERIWLQVWGDEVTWSAEKVDDQDVAYVRAETAEQQLAEAQQRVREGQ